jgi:hypothetical protein
MLQHRLQRMLQRRLQHDTLQCMLQQNVTTICHNETLQQYITMIHQVRDWWL